MRGSATKVLIAGGGTGGHLFPGIAVAEALRERGVTDVLFVSAGRAGWREAIERAGFAWRSLPVRGFGRRPGLAHVAFPLRLAASLVVAGALVVSFRPSAVVGTGGYVSGPVVAMAWLFGVPVLLLEQNTVPGATTRIAARFAREIHVAYGESEARLPRGARERVRVSGNPVRASLLGFDRAAARTALGLAGDAPVLLVLGGSQGAAALNRAVHGALAAGAEWAQRLQLVVQTGAHDALDWESVRGAALRLVVRPFFHAVGEAYAAADVVFCRAGATTLAELTALGKASVIFPYPHATADHQTRNAELLAAAGAARVVSESDLSPERVASEVSAIVGDAERRHAMEAAARALGRPDAAARVAEAVLRLGKGRGDSWNTSARS
jgi:UDP-N-acetylglucosamine--N-acetylmuramyl-(pentapeptide) pyrophosphoryl-undecaprenol N-acetylglucosamine transferase